MRSSPGAAAPDAKAPPSAAVDASSQVGREHLLPLALAALAVLLFLAQSAAHLGTFRDDAYISFRYAERFANGQGLTFNPGEPVEGYTNFLWVLLQSALSSLGLDLTTLVGPIGALCGALTVVLAFLFARNVAKHAGTLKPWSGAPAALLVALFPSHAFYAVTGLETSLFSLLLLGSAFAWYRRCVTAFSCLVFLALLTRPEAGLLALVGGADLILRGPNQKRALFILAATAAVGAAYLAFKASYFGAWLPNTRLAKPTDIALGLDYLKRAGLETGLFFVAALLTGLRVRALLALALTSAAYLLSLFAVGGDWMPGLRLVVPLLPIALVLAEPSLLWLGPKALRVGLALGTLGLLVAWGFALGGLFHVSLIVSGYEPVRQSAFNTLAKEGIQSVGTLDIGLLGFTQPHFEILDLGGLTDTVISHLPGGLHQKYAPAGYLNERCPDAFVFSAKAPLGRGPGGSVTMLAHNPAEAHVLTLPWFGKNYRTLREWRLAHDYYLLTFVRKGVNLAAPERPRCTLP